MKQTHKIRKQSLFINFTNEAEAMSWNRTASEFNQRKILPVLDRLLDQFAGKKEYYEIEKLEIDIGSVSEGNFLTVFEKELERKLENIFQSLSTAAINRNFENAEHAVVGVKHSGDQSGNNTNVKESSHWIETFRYFLEFGSLPWNSRAETIRHLEKEITGIISRNELKNSAIFQKQLLNTAVRKRLHYQFSKEFNIQVLSRLFDSEFQLLLKIHAAFMEIFNSSAQKDGISKKWKTIHEKSEFKNTLQIAKWIDLEAGSKAELWPMEYIGFLVKTDFRKDERHALETLKNAVQLSEQHSEEVVLQIRKYLKDKEFEVNEACSLNGRNLSIYKKQTIANDQKTSIENESETEKSSKLKTKKLPYVKAESTSENQSKHVGNSSRNTDQFKTEKRNSGERITEIPDARIQTETDKVFTKGKKIGSKDLLKKQEAMLDPELNSRQKEELKKDSAQISKESKQKKQSKDAELLKAAEKKKNQTFKNSSIHEFQTEPDFYYLNHAGVLLTWPYLTPMFRMLGFTENNQFKNERFQHRAVHMLAYTATGRKQSEEPQLLVAKLLCGMPLQLPIINNIRLKKKEKDEVNRMLENMVANWKILKNTSVEGLRSSFFAREGKVMHEDGQWKIIVEQKSFDMLLDHLPYPISIIKLPWMNEMLKVDWM